MEPVVRSIFAAQAGHEFDPTKVNIFGCGSTLGNLLRFACSIDAEKPFRFLVEVVGETVFFIRRENTPKETIPDVRGYGHSFPEAYTTWDVNVRGSESHQRIIRYQLGDLSIIIRFEADGYLTDKIPVQATIPISQNQDEESLVAALAGNTVKENAYSDLDPLRLVQGSGTVPQGAVFDLKTRSIRKKAHDTTMSDQIPRLWIRQIPSFVLAYHERGLFRTEEVTVHNVKPDVEKWENDHKRDVRKLIALIRKIADFVRLTPERKLEVRYQYGGGLELREQHEGVVSVLPDDLAARWAGEGEQKTSVDQGVALGDSPIGGGVALGADVDGGNVDGLDDNDEYDWDKQEQEPDYTACSADSCGYCGHCSY
jgi:hypothetical protein